MANDLLAWNFLLNLCWPLLSVVFSSLHTHIFSVFGEGIASILRALAIKHKFEEYNIDLLFFLIKEII